MTTLHAAYLAVQKSMRSRGLPFEVVYGPQRVPDTVGNTRVEFSADREAGDGMLPARSQRANPKQVAVRALGGVCRIFARATMSGAEVHNHEALALKIADMVHTALHEHVRLLPSLWRISKAGFLTDKEKPDGWLGEVYEFRFQIDRAVAVLTWQDEAAPEGEFTTGSTTLTTSGPGTSSALPSASTRI